MIVKREWGLDGLAWEYLRWGIPSTVLERAEWEWENDPNWMMRNQCDIVVRIITFKMRYRMAEKRDGKYEIEINVA